MTDHDSQEFRRIAIPAWLYAQIKTARAELVRRGLDSVPVDLIPPEYQGGDVTLGLVIAMGHRALLRRQERP